MDHFSVFKGEPLTVRDAFSRYVLTGSIGANTKGAWVRRVLERLFRVYGLPLALQSDNGSPFVCTKARGGLTRLSVWLVSLGVRLVRSRPGCPQDNGGHERMHRDMSELQQAPAKSRRAQQRACDEWLLDFNHVRPHQALKGKTPAEVYRSSIRRSLVPKVPTYPDDWVTRRVSPRGYVRVHGDEVFIVDLRHPLDFLPLNLRRPLFFLFLALTVAYFAVFQLLPQKLFFAAHFLVAYYNKYITLLNKTLPPLTFCRSAAALCRALIPRPCVALTPPPKKKSFSRLGAGVGGGA